MTEPSGVQSWAIMLGVAFYLVASWLYSVHLNPRPLPYPDIGLASDDGGQSYRVTRTKDGLAWGDFSPVGCSQRPSGPVQVGDMLQGCRGLLQLYYMKFGEVGQ